MTSEIAIPKKGTNSAARMGQSLTLKSKVRLRQRRR